MRIFGIVFLSGPLQDHNPNWDILKLNKNAKQDYFVIKAFQRHDLNILGEETMPMKEKKNVAIIGHHCLQ